MAGKKRFTLRLVVLALVLAAGGAGAYHFTSGQGALWDWLKRGAADEATTLTPSNDELSSTVRSGASDLDALTSAWAQPAAPSQADYVEASPSARSADVTRAAAESRIEPANKGRYDRYGDYSSASDYSPARNSAESTDASLNSVGHSDDRNYPARLEPSNDAAVMPTAVLPAVSPSLARGQDPGVSDAAEDDGDLPAAVAQGIAGASNSNTGALQLPQDSPGTGANYTSAAERARQAFSDQPTAATARDRYNSAASAAGDGTPFVNPFAQQPAQLPAAKTAGSPMDADPALPTMNSGQSNNLTDASRNYDRPQEPRRIPSAGLGSAAAGYGGGQILPPGGDLAGALSGGLISPNTDSLATAEGTGRPGERALEGPQNPSLMIQKLAPAEIQVNQPAKFLIQVRNVGGQAASDVMIRDEVPKGTRLVSTSPSTEESGGQLVWQLGTLSIGEEKTVEMQLMPTDEGEIGSVATVSYSAQASIKTLSTKPNLAIRMTAPQRVMIGQELRVKILLSNPGSGDATNVMLFETVPEQLRHESGAALEFEVGTLRAGETREMELVLAAEKPGKVINVLSARAEGNLQVDQELEFEVIAPALTVAVSGPDRRYLERPATYEVSVENPGTAPAREVQLVTKLPRGMQFVRANNMGEYDAGTHSVYWSLAELPEGERGTVELVAMPVETGSQMLAVEGHAQQGLSDSTEQPILVEGLAAILFEVRDLEDPIEVGKETGYEIRVVNQGSKAARNVQVAVQLPQGMKVVSAEGETRHSVQPNGILFAPIRELAPKADTLYRLRVQCLRPGDQRVTVSVNTDDISQPVRKEESTRVFGDE